MGIVSFNIKNNDEKTIIKQIIKRYQNEKQKSELYRYTVGDALYDMVKEIGVEYEWGEINNTGKFIIKDDNIAVFTKTTKHKKDDPSKPNISDMNKYILELIQQYKRYSNAEAQTKLLEIGLEKYGINDLPAIADLLERDIKKSGDNTNQFYI